MGHAGHHFIMHGIMRAGPPPLSRAKDYARASRAGKYYARMRFAELCPSARRKFIMRDIMRGLPVRVKYYARPSFTSEWYRTNERPMV